MRSQALGRWLAPVVAALGLWSSAALAAPPQPGTGGEGRGASFLDRMYSLRQAYRGKVHIATYRGRPAVFINTNFGRGETYDWTAQEQAKFEAFRTDFLKAMGTNTVQLWNPVGDDWLHVGTGLGTNARLSADRKGKTMKVYNYYDAEDFALPEPGEQRTTVLAKLNNIQLDKFNRYITAIERDFEGTLGETEYNGGVPPYVTGRRDGSHNCTSWMSSWLNKEVDRNIPYGADPPSWCRTLAERTDSQALRGMVIFNHPNAPRTGSVVPENFRFLFE
ncbi:MAG: hypothetical protein IT371_00255 [Deltaproteobacteria bacterium]|nr:hypothetical protein [Deltaproteobacteria bacterium]